MKKYIGILVLCALLVSMAVGCGGKTGGDNTNKSASESNTEISETAAPETVENSEKALWPKVYVDAAGNQVTIEKQPERVISAFHAMFPDYLYALDVYPIAAPSADTLLSQWGAYKEYTSKQPVIDIGASNALNLEKILELEPDLILATAFQAEAYNELSKIAPTVILDYASINTDWKSGVTEFVKLFGKEERAEEIISEVETAVKDAAQKLQGFREKNESVVFISITGKNIWPYSISQLQVVYDVESGLGLKAPKDYPLTAHQTDPLALEALSQYNPDHIFLMTDYGDKDAEQWLKELKSNPVWTSISAIKNDNVYMTDRSIFAFNAPIATKHGVKFVAESLGE